MEEKLYEVKVAIIDRITNAVSDTSAKILPADLKTLAIIVLLLSIQKGDEKYADLIAKFITQIHTEI